MGSTLRAASAVLALLAAIPTAGALGLDVALDVELSGVKAGLAVDGLALGLELGDERLHAASATTAAPASAALPAAAPAAVATVGLLALLQATGALRFLLGAAIALYFRVMPHELLDNAHREKVLALVRASPGIGPSDIMRSLGMGWGTTSYHLDRLERAGLILSERAGHRRCYFPPGTVDRDTRRLVGLVRGQSARQVASLVLERPGLTQSEVCATLGLSASAASKHVSRLEEAGLVRRAGDVRGNRVYPEPTLATALGVVAA